MECYLMLCERFSLMRFLYKMGFAYKWFLRKGLFENRLSRKKFFGNHVSSNWKTRPRYSLNLFHKSILSWRNKRKSMACLSRAAPSANALHIIFRIFRQVIVEDHTNSNHINATSCNIRCYQNAKFSRLKYVESCPTLSK